LAEVKKEDEEEHAHATDPFPGAVVHVDEDADQDVKDAMIEADLPDAIAHSVDASNSLCEVVDSADHDRTSIISAAGTELMCYMIGTTLRSAQGEMTRVEDLKPEDKLMAADGSIVEVRDIKRVASSDRTLAWLESATFKVPLTVNHKVMVIRGTQRQSLPAGHLRPGDRVLCRNGEQVLCDVTWFLSEDDVFEVVVEPHAELDTCYIPSEMDAALLTKAKRMPRNRIPCRMFGAQAHGRSASGLTDDD